jgi:isoleucyl-tRNA synthetase
MSKSLGNVVLPTLVIDGGKNRKQQPAYGADVLRFWVATVDYTSDVSIGDAIIKQTFDSYRKIRNTFRYFLGNLNDFNAKTTDVTFESLPEVDRFILSRLAVLMTEAEDAYKSYNFMRVVSLCMQFISADVSNFYLNGAKDRLYISAKDDLRRRTCQFTMDILLNSLASILAPILPHLAEDVFLNLPDRPAEKDSIFQMLWPKVDASKFETHAGMGTWEQFLSLRDDVNSALALARADKVIGAELDAKVTIVVPKDVGEYADLVPFMDYMNSRNNDVDELNYLLVTSQAQVIQGDDKTLEGHAYTTAFGAGATPFGVIVERADGVKCVRCWEYWGDVGDDTRFPGICSKCVKVLDKMGFAALADKVGSATDE